MYNNNIIEEKPSVLMMRRVDVLRTRNGYIEDAYRLELKASHWKMPYLMIQMFDAKLRALY